MFSLLRTVRFWVTTCGIACLICGLTGCGESKSTTLAVNGTASHADSPIPGATVYFTRADGGAVSWGVTDDAGRFQLQHSRGIDGAEPGRYKVSIAFRPKTVEEEMQLTNGTFPPAVTYAEVIKKFGTAQVSTVEVEVTASQTSFDLKFD